ncbi:MAG: hypothetical protein Q4F13_10585 [Pseudomonadota bacterium]|nr:hypothetical protein [Pseudomonadota bacterium]
MKHSYFGFDESRAGVTVWLDSGLSGLKDHLAEAGYAVSVLPSELKKKGAIKCLINNQCKIFLTRGGEGFEYSLLRKCLVILIKSREDDLTVARRVMLKLTPKLMRLLENWPFVSYAMVCAERESVFKQAKQLTEKRKRHEGRACGPRKNRRKL